MMVGRFFTSCIRLIASERKGRVMNIRQRWKVALCSFVAAFLVCAALPISAQAAGTYTLRFSLERSTVSSSEIAAGDVTLQAAVYITGNASAGDTFSAISMQYESSDSRLSFQNMTVGDNATIREDATTYDTSVGTFTTTFIPYCFGTLSNGHYDPGDPQFQTTTYARLPVDPDSVLYSTGDGGVTYSLTYYQGVDTDGNGVLERDDETGEITKTYECDVTENTDGSGTYQYTYVDQTTYETVTATGTIPRFEYASLPAGTPIPGTNDQIAWLVGANQVETGASFFGETTDEFPFFYVDVVLEQGTPDGVYTVSFDTNSCQLLGADATEYAYNTQSATIVVGDALTTASVPQKSDVFCCDKDDTSPIMASDFASGIIATVSYTDETGAVVQADTDITSQTDCGGVTPASLFEGATGGYVITELPLYYNDTPLLDADGNPLTEKILIGTRGDLNYDGNIDIEDAFTALSYYAHVSVSATDVSIYTGNDRNTDLEILTYFLADIDTASQDHGADGGAIEVDDAYYILSYYARDSVGQPASWEEILNGNTAD